MTSILDLIPEFKPFLPSAGCNIAQMWWVHNKGYLGLQNTEDDAFIFNAEQQFLTITKLILNVEF